MERGQAEHAGLAAGAARIKAGGNQGGGHDARCRTLMQQSIINSMYGKIMTPAASLFSGVAHAARRACRTALGTALLLAAGAVQAHPHSWIDVQSKLVFAADGLLVAIEEQWTFDELYTSYVVEEMAGGKTASPAVVRQFAAKVITNLEPYSYFMDVRADGKAIKLGKIREYQSELRGQRLWLKFVAPLATPIDPVHQSTAFSVYDPTYFIDMQHENDAAVSLVSAPAACRTTLQRPTPGKDSMARAFAMDKNAAIDNTLGRQFAQKVVLACK
jgi:ABC-type uncharacterized transport system substrate-binding protein